MPSITTVGELVDSLPPPKEPEMQTAEKTKVTDVPTIDFTCEPTSTGGAVVIPAAEAPAQPLVPVSESAAILSIIERAASDPRVDIDKMERLIAMQERVQASRARVEFDNAMSSAQEAMKAIRVDLENKQTKSNYASYAQLDKAVRPIYAAHGFALSFNTGDSPNPVEVRVLCTVSHRGGHPMTYMPIFSSSSAIARQFEKANAIGHADEAKDIRDEISAALVGLVHALNALKEAGVDVKEGARALHDDIENRDAALCKIIDEAGHFYEPRDMAGLTVLT